MAPAVRQMHAVRTDAVGDHCTDCYLADTASNADQVVIAYAAGVGCRAIDPQAVFRAELVQPLVVLVRRVGEEGLFTGEQAQLPLRRLRRRRVAGKRVEAVPAEPLVGELDLPRRRSESEAGRARRTVVSARAVRPDAGLVKVSGRDTKRFELRSDVAVDVVLEVLREPHPRG